MAIVTYQICKEKLAFFVGRSLILSWQCVHWQTLDHSLSFFMNLVYFWSIWSSLARRRRREAKGYTVCTRIIGNSWEADWRKEVLWWWSDRLFGSSSRLDSSLAQCYGRSRWYQVTWCWEVSITPWMVSKLHCKSCHQRTYSTTRDDCQLFQFWRKLQAFPSSRQTMKASPYLAANKMEEARAVQSLKLFKLFFFFFLFINLLFHYISNLINLA